MVTTTIAGIEFIEYEIAEQIIQDLRKELTAAKNEIAEVQANYEDCRGECNRAEENIEHLDKQCTEMGHILDGMDLCCCGNSVKDHGYTDNHGAVSMLDHMINCQIQEATRGYMGRIKCLETELRKQRPALIAVFDKELWESI